MCTSTGAGARTCCADRVPKGDGVSPRSVGRTVLAGVWMPLVAVVAVGVGAVAMLKVHQFSEPPPVVTVNEPAAPPEFSIKRIDYEVFGSLGQGGTLVWVDY